MNGEYTTPAELADKLQISAETVRQKARNGKWPSSRIGKLNRFNDEDVTEIRELIKNPMPRRPGFEPGSVQDLINRL